MSNDWYDDYKKMWSWGDDDDDDIEYEIVEEY